jgi:endo-1,4-beta-xylanase
MSKTLSFLITACMVTSVFAKVPVLVKADTTSIISNGTFDDGTTTGWAPRGGVTLTATTEEKSSGTHSLKVAGRTANWNGPSLDLKGKLQKDVTYNISLKVKVVKGQAEAGAANTEQKITVSMQRKEAGAANDSYDTIAWQKTVNEESWTTIAGTYKPTFDSYQTLTLYVESPNASLQFYVDDFSMTAPDGAVATAPASNAANLIASGSFENGAAGWYARQSAGGTLVVADTTETAATGTHSLKVTGRQEGWNGPAYSVKSLMQNGRTYNVSMKVKAVAGQSAKGLIEKVKLSMERQIDKSPTYTNISSDITISENTWTTVSGEYSLNYAGNLDLLDIYVESSTANLEFYVDDVVITDTTPVNTGNIVTNSTFEGGITGWATNGGNVTLNVVDEAHHGGSKSLKAEGRAANWAGPSYDLTSKLVPGKSYNVSLWVMYNSGNNDTETIKATFKPGYATVGQVTAKKGEWVELKGSLTAPAEGAASIYVEAPNAELPSFYVDDLTIVGEMPVKPLEIQQDIPGLAVTLNDYFKVGGAVNPGDLGNNSLTEQLIKKHYSTVTAENAMKPDSTQREEGKFTFDQADKIVDFAIANNKEMRGHTLVWHSQVPDWFFQDPADPTKPASKELLLERERIHIRTVLNHYKEKYGSKSPIKYWDVVNEVIDDQGNYRNSKWYQISGLDYIKVAFETAREVDPSLKLYINDYNIERNNAKTQKLYELVKELKAQGVPIDGVGMQMHITSDIAFEDIKASIEKYASLGVDIQVTELDVRMGVENENVTNEVLQQQARYYKQLFDILKNHKNVINTVIFWGVVDDTSWYKTSKPLIFDGKFQAKPAFYAIVDPTKATVNRQAINAAQGNPINSNDASWTTVKSINANNFVKGQEGATAKVQTMWDSKNLYVKAYVSDATAGAKDSIEIFVDKKNDKAEAYKEDANHKRIEVKRSEGSVDSKGYTAYVTVSLDDIAPALNGVLGFDVRVSDDKGTGNVDSIAIFNDYGNRQNTNAAFFADLKLSGPSKLAKAAYGTPVIDGVKDDVWSASEEISTQVWVSGTAGATAKAKAMWDEKNLYVITEVTDDVLNKSNTNVWEQDSIEIFVDQNNAKTSSYQKDDYQLRVNFENEQSNGGGGGKPEGFKSVVKKTANGYVIEQVIPLTAITATAGKILGFDVQVNNANASGARASVATWCDPSGNSYASTAGFGNLMLVDPRVQDQSAKNLPKTGSIVDYNTIVLLGIALLTTGISILKKRRLEE